MTGRDESPHTLNVEWVPYDPNLPTWTLRDPRDDDDQLIAVIDVPVEVDHERQRRLGTTAVVMAGPGWRDRDVMRFFAEEIQPRLSALVSRPGAADEWRTTATGLQLHLFERFLPVFDEDAGLDDDSEDAWTRPLSSLIDHDDV